MLGEFFIGLTGAVRDHALTDLAAHHWEFRHSDGEGFAPWCGHGLFHCTLIGWSRQLRKPGDGFSLV
jgi:hypothetical protein